jgi:hypothetical protein
VFCVKFLETICRYAFLLEKQPIKKKYHLKWSPRSGVMIILKYANFQGFSMDDCVIFFISVEVGDEVSQTNNISVFLSQFHPISTKKIIRIRAPEVKISLI